MEGIILTVEAEQTIFAFQTLQSTTNTNQAIRVQHMCSALSTKCHCLTLLRKMSMTTTHLVPSALSSHVVRCWWCQHGTTVPVNGPRSIMGTWWLNIIITRVKKISSALTKMLSISLAAKRTWMVHCCTRWRDIVAHYRVVHMFKVKSSLALCAPSEGSKDCPF